MSSTFTAMSASTSNPRPCGLVDPPENGGLKWVKLSQDPSHLLGKSDLCLRKS
jgi:hypothetical protein